jgi:predicted patatin/cPLA2 family phospholipase
MSRDGEHSRAARSLALLVEGGGLRGAFSAGALAEFGAPGSPKIDDLVAVSSAAPTAAYLAAGQVEDGIRIWENYTHGSQLISPANWLRLSPLMAIDRLVQVFERTVVLDAARAESSSTRCWVSVTNCHSGEVEHVRATAGNMLPLLKATMAIPIAYGKVVHVGETPYVDGGVAHPVPVEHTLSLGRDHTVVILTQPRGYRRRPNPVIARFMALTYARYPALGPALKERWRVANRALETIESLEDQGRISVIRPRAPLPASRFSRRREDILATIAAGRAAARAWLDGRRD